jgi:hypothetical protein
MGGMIAMFMAQTLMSRNEEVLKVIMIDSANPEAFPSFVSVEQHKAFAKATYAKISQTLEAETSVECECPDEPLIDTQRRGSDDSLTVSRQTTWSSVDSGLGSSRASSVFDFDSPETRPGTPMSLICSSDETSACCSDDEDMDKTDTWCEFDDEDDECETEPLQDLFLNINLHVHQGIGLIANVSPGDLFQPGTRSDFDVLLVKCRPEPLDAKHKHYNVEGAEYIRRIMQQSSMAWDASRFRSFESVPFSGHHDGAFEPHYVGELSMILRAGLENVG